MSKSPFIVGIDAGGTSVRIAVARADDGVLLKVVETAAAAEGGPEPLLNLLPTLLNAVAVKTEEVQFVCAGITKFTRAGIAGRWSTALADRFSAERVQVVPDYEIGFHGALPGGRGVMVIAGTGSVAFASNGVVSARVGGRGWEYGDEGSGAFLTAEAVRRTLRALDGLETPSPLTESVCTLLGTRDAALLGEAARQRASAEGRGFLVPHLLEQVRQGDPDAMNLFVGAGGWLAALVRAGLRKVEMIGDSPQVAMVGGLWQAGDVLVGPFTRVVRRWYPDAQIGVAADGPLVGAVRVARREMKTVPA